VEIVSEQTKDGSSLHSSVYVMHSQLQYLESNFGRQRARDIGYCKTEEEVNVT
jgi:hypothetical protein